MTNINIRQFHLEDLPSVLELYHRLMEEKKPRYCRTIDAGQLTRQYFGHPEYRDEGLFVAERNKQIIGFIFGAVRLYPITADDDLPGVFVSLILVDKKYQRRGIGSKLLEKVAEFGRKHGKTLICASANPMNPLAFWPGVNRDWKDIVGFLQSHGFTAPHYEVSMEQNIDNFVLSDYVSNKLTEMTADGFRFIPYTPDYHDKLLQLAGWPFWHIDLQSKIDLITHPFIETAFLDFDYENIYGPEDITIVTSDEDELCGFVVLCRNPGDTISYLGPIRISAKYKGCGMGSVMIQTALLREREQGIQIVDLWCSQDNANNYYSRNGFVQHDTWEMYERKL